VVDYIAKYIDENGVNDVFMLSGGGIMQVETTL
jgi:thiamine pyrophosphate-dependent acetolactate synthase large subunit-like protein